MEKKVIELLGLMFRSLIRCWTSDSKIQSQNLIDMEQFAQKCGLNVLEAKKFDLSIQGFVMEIAQNFIREIDDEIDNDERKDEILNQIIVDVSKIVIDEKTVISEFEKPESLRRAIMDVGTIERKSWDEKERAVYSNCVRYISKTCVEFVSKWPSFTPEALKVIIERQNEYNEVLQKILKELQSMESLSRNTELTFREYEKRYRDIIIERYGKVELIGSGINNRRIKRYDISSAYVELDCVEDELEEEVELSEVFNYDNIVWIGGEAGSGKTTFLKWIAVCSAKNDYNKVKNIRNTIPIIIGLRSVKNWPLNLQVLLNEFSKSFGYECPDGWGDKILDDNRALILIDGLDEITDEKREETYEFIENLLLKYPNVKILVTARNSVENKLNCFCRRYEISPMKMNNIKKFIFYWHRSVLHSDAVVEDGEIRTLQNNLIAKITQSSPLKLLARNPLLCAMLCALHYENNKLLPENKMELYESCCKMLIDARDAERRIERNDYYFLQQLDYSKKKRVLEELAYWMLRNNNSSEQKDNVIEFLEQLFKNTNIILQIGEKCTADKMLDFLVERSGIIREPEDGVIDFIHKTFMEYLAVKSICRNCDWNKLVEHACDINWKETIIMCFNEMGVRQVSQVLEQLVEKGRKEKEDRYILLASLGASNAVFADLEIKKQIDKQVAKMIPPKREQISEMAQAGNYLLPFLFDSDKFPDNGKERCLTLLQYLGTEEIIPYVISYIHGNGKHTVKQFALEILGGFDETVLNEYSIKEQLVENIFVKIQDEKLVTYEHLLNIINDIKLGEDDIRTLNTVKNLKIVCGLEVDNLYYGCTEFYKYFSKIESLHLSGKIYNTSVLNGYHRLQELTIESDGDLSAIIEELGELEGLDNIETLVIRTERLKYFCENDLKNMPNIKFLEFHCLDNELEFDFTNFEKLEKLEKIIIEVDCYLAQDIGKQVPLWKDRLKNLQVEII